MHHIDVEAVENDLGQRFELLKRFVGFTQDDEKALRESLRLVGPKLPGLLDAIYEHLFSFDDSYRAFLGTDSTVTAEYMAIRKEHLTEWLMRVAEGGEGLSEYLTRAGQAHSRHHGTPGRSIPLRYMVGLTGYLQGAILNLVAEVAPDEVARVGGAWNKILTAQLELFLKVLIPSWDDVH